MQATSTTGVSQVARVAVLSSVFVFSLVLGGLLLPQWNSFDWDMVRQGMTFMLRGQNPYPIGWTLEPHYEFFYPPHTLLLWGPLVSADARWVVAAGVALWLVFVMAGRRVAPLLLLLHPVFIMLMAAANVEIAGTLLGWWLLLGSPKGVRRGLALALLAIKPQTTILLLAYEGLRAIAERDVRALLTGALLVGVPMAFFPLWLPNIFANPVDAWTFPFSIVGVGGVPLALIVTAVILAVMALRRRLHEHRALALYLSLVWTPYVLPFSFVTTFFPLRQAGWRAVSVFLLGGFALLPLMFQDYHTLERAGNGLFLLMAVMVAPRTPPPPQAGPASTGPLPADALRQV